MVHHRRVNGDRIETTVHATGRLRLDPPGLELDVANVFQSANPAA